MAWVDDWIAIFGEDPADRTSREVSVQEVLAALIVGRKPAWFEPCAPTAPGDRFLRDLWHRAFGTEPDDDVEWFVSEYALPVPPEWRDEIGLTYGCPDFACSAGNQVLIVELKTESGSYRKRQMSDYLRLARRKHPVEWVDVALLGPTRPGAKPHHDERQRYAELTWREVPDLLRTAFEGHPTATDLMRFLELEFAAAAMRPAATADPARAPVDELAAAAIAHARRIAPSVAGAKPGDPTERGIDVPLTSLEAARAAQQAVRIALQADGLDEHVSVWLWQPSSSGVAATEAGREQGRELRLAPRRRRGQ